MHQRYSQVERRRTCRGEDEGGLREDLICYHNGNVVGSANENNEESEPSLVA